MKKIILILLLSLGLFAENCEQYLINADKYRITGEEFLKEELGKEGILQNKSQIKYGFSTERSLIILMYQDRYKICKEIEEKRK